MIYHVYAQQLRYRLCGYPLPKTGTMCLTKCPPRKAGPANVATQKYLPKTGTVCLSICPPSNTSPANVDIQKYLPKPGTTSFPRSYTLATADSQIPQHWSEYTTKVISKAETVEACRKNRGGNNGRRGNKTCKYTRTHGVTMESKDAPGSAFDHTIIDHGLPSRRWLSLSECITTWTTRTSKPSQEQQQCSWDESKRERKEDPSALEQFDPRSGASTHQSRWKKENNPSTK